MAMAMAAAGRLEQQGEDAFRRLFKYYKRRKPPPDLSAVLDFSRAQKNLKVGAGCVSVNGRNPPACVCV